MRSTGRSAACVAARMEAAADSSLDADSDCGLVYVPIEPFGVHIVVAVVKAL